MRKGIIIFCAVLATSSLTAFGYLNWSDGETHQEKQSCNNPAPFETDFSDMLLPNSLNKNANNNFFYDVDSRFKTTITRKGLNTVKTIIDLLPDGATDGLSDFKNVKVSLLHEDGETSEMGGSEVLNAAQLKLLQSIDYSSDFYITSDCKYDNPKTGRSEKYDLVYYMTVIPETEAVYTDGNDAIIAYFMENSKAETTMLDPKQLKPGKISFVVGKDGTVGTVELNSTSGYDSVDKKMIELVKKMPRKWAPATDEKGESVDQKFVFFFGMIGC